MSADPSLKHLTKPSLTIRRRFAAPPAKVYGAWTDPAKIAHWWGSETLYAEADARVGGRYRIGMRTADGEQHDVSGVYHQMVPNEKLVFSWAWRTTPERESLVTLTFRRDGDGTLFTLTHEQLFDGAARDRHQAGWNAGLDRLEKSLARPMEEADETTPGRQTTTFRGL